MNFCLYKFKCSKSLALAIGAVPMSLSKDHNHLSFKVYNPPKTYFAEIEVENYEHYVWFVKIDKFGILRLQ